MPQEIYKLSPADRELFYRSRLDGGDARYFTDYYLNGWLFDKKIEDPWQLEMHHAEQSDLTVIGGFGSGKTVPFGISYLVRCCTIPYYRFLNVASVAYQSRQMYEAILLVIQNTRLKEWFIDQGGKVIERPYPVIEVANDYIGYSSMEFMSADKNGVKILSWEGDAVHIDEAGLLEDLEGTVRNLGTRLRGTVRCPDLFEPGKLIDRPRESRLSMTSNSWENPYMWWRLDMARALPDEYYGRILSTYANKNLTDKQIRNFENKVTSDEDRQRWFLGARPKGSGDQFSEEMIESNTDRGLNAVMDEAIAARRPGFLKESADKCGVIIWEMPADKSRNYMVIGDPGQGNPPHRNAPCIAVWDITDFPNGPAVLRAFWWGMGQGSYQPFVQTMWRYAERYTSTDIAFDATGTQKMMDELVFERDGLPTIGLNMTTFKHTFNTALKLFLDKGMMHFPDIIGIRAQLGNYVIPDTKIAQDIVAVFQMSAGYLRRYYYVSQEEDEEEVGALDEQSGRYTRATSGRYARSTSRAPRK